MQRTLARLIPLVLLATGLAACGDSGGEGHRRARRAVPHVYTTFYPTTYFAARIAGDRAQVFCPLPAGADPAHWKPSSAALTAYQDDADLIFVNGAGLEAWTEKAGLPRGRMFDTARSFRTEWIRYASAVKHAHGGEEHAHEGTDPHTWLDPLLAVRQVEAIDRRLREQWPEHGDIYEPRAHALVADLRALHAELGRLKQADDGTWIYAAQPVYDYVARRYGWRVHGLDLDPDTVPTDGEFSFLTGELGQKPARYLWWPRAPKPEVAAAIRAKTGLESVVFDWGAQPPSQGDYLDLMRSNVARIRACFDK